MAEMADDPALEAATKPKPRTARGKRWLRKREPLDVENPKSCMMLRGNKSTPEVSNLLRDLHRLRQPLSTLFIRRHPYHPFENIEPLEKLCTQYDHSLFTFGSSSKKRPFRLLLGRHFDFRLLDMMEFSVKNYVPTANFRDKETVMGSKPLVVFQGPAFETDERLKRAKSLLLDLFSGPRPEQVLLEGLDQVVVCSAVEDTTGIQGAPHMIMVRRFRQTFLKSGSKLPRVELEEMGPRFDLALDRSRDPDRDRWKSAIKVPKIVKPKKVKNESKDKLGRKRGAIHLGRQDFDKIHTVHHGLSKSKKLRQEVAAAKVA